MKKKPVNTDYKFVCDVLQKKVTDLTLTIKDKDSSLERFRVTVDKDLTVIQELKGKLSEAERRAERNEHYAKTRRELQQQWAAELAKDRRRRVWSEVVCGCLSHGYDDSTSFRTADNALVEYDKRVSDGRL